MAFGVRIPERRSLLDTFHALSELIRSRPNGYFYGFGDEDRISLQDIMAANVFASKLNRSPLEIEDIEEVRLSYSDRGLHVEHIVVVIHHGDHVDNWDVSEEEFSLIKIGFEILKHSIAEAEKRKQPASYKIEQGLLRTSNGGDMWNGIVDLSAYDHFWWDEFTLKANGRYSKEALVFLHLPGRPQDPQFKEKMLEEIFQAMKEMKPCVKK